jgi:hypothetical protein
MHRSSSRSSGGRASPFAADGFSNFPRIVAPAEIYADGEAAFTYYRKFERTWSAPGSKESVSIRERQNIARSCRLSWQYDLWTDPSKN